MLQITLKILNSPKKCGWAIVSHAKHNVAAIAQKTTNTASFMVVVDIECYRLAFTHSAFSSSRADFTTVVLRFQQGCILCYGKSLALSPPITILRYCTCKFWVHTVIWLLPNEFVSQYNYSMNLEDCQVSSKSLAFLAGAIQQVELLTLHPPSRLSRLSTFGRTFEKGLGSHAKRPHLRQFFDTVNLLTEPEVAHAQRVTRVYVICLRDT